MFPSLRPPPTPTESIYPNDVCQLVEVPTSTHQYPPVPAVHEVHCLKVTDQAVPRWLQTAVKRVGMYWNMYRQGRPTLTDRRDAPDEWCGLVSHRMNEKEKACDYFDPKRRSETMEDMIRSSWTIVIVMGNINNRYR